MAPSIPRNIPVVIIGAGPTGLTTANLLCKSGVACIVLEREPEPLNLPRAIVLDDEGARTLQPFGLTETYLSDTLPSSGSKYYTDTGLCFAETGSGIESYGFPKRQFIYQPEMETALRDSLAKQNPSALHFSSEVVSARNVDGGVEIDVRCEDGDISTIQTQWLLACDGGRSPIRESLGIKMTGNTYAQDWIVLDTIDDPDQSLHSKFFCSNSRPHVSVPAPHGGRRYEFMLLPGETDAEVLRDEFLTDLLKPFRVFDVSKVLRRTVYTFHARIAERFRQGRILLMGDAAHLTPPFAGQGMNAGLRDAHNVSWKLASIINGGASNSIIDSYDLERRKPAWDMIQLAVVMGDFVMPLSKDKIVFRDQLMNALVPFPEVKDYLIQMRFKPKPRHHDGLYLDLDTCEFDGSLVGEMIPQPVLNAQDQQMRFDERLGIGFALVAQNEEGARALQSCTRDRFAGLPLSKNVLTRKEMENQAEITRPLRTHRDQILLIRPDRYCAAAFYPDQLERRLADYEKLLSASSADNSREMESAVSTKAS